MTDRGLVSFGLVTDREEWQPMLAALLAAGIDASSVTIRQEHHWEEGAKRFRLGPRVEVEVRHERTWTMDAAARAVLETDLQTAAKTEWRGDGLRFLWHKPVAVGWAAAWLGAKDKLWREWHRRNVDAAAVDKAEKQLADLHHRVWKEGEDWEPLLPRLQEIVDGARRHPQAAAKFGPAGPGRIEVAEVMDVLRRIAGGEIAPRIVSPKGGWKTFVHGIGRFEAAGWTIESFKRNEGMKYVQTVTSPDGRTADYDFFDAREGDPFCLLTDDEQDKVCDALERA